MHESNCQTLSYEQKISESPKGQAGFLHLERGKNFVQYNIIILANLSFFRFLLTSLSPAPTIQSSNLKQYKLTDIWREQTGKLMTLEHQVFLTQISAVILLIFVELFIVYIIPKISNYCLCHFPCFRCAQMWTSQTCEIIVILCLLTVIAFLMWYLYALTSCWILARSWSSYALSVQCSLFCMIFNMHSRPHDLVGW